MIGILRRTISTNRFNRHAVILFILLSLTHTANQNAAGAEDNPVPPAFAASGMTEATTITMNFYQADIREILSGIAMNEQVNIVMAQEVSGEVSVHLYEVPLEKALSAISNAGGFRCHRKGDVYFVFKPQTAVEINAADLALRTFKLRYADIEKVQDVLSALPNIRMVQVHAPSKTVIAEDIPRNIERIAAVIRFWDAKPRQVTIEAKIMEITLTDDMVLGVNWEKVLGDVRIGTGGFSTAVSPTDTVSSPIPKVGKGLFANIITGAGTDRQFTAAIDALQSRTKINMLSTPKILAIHGKPARVQVGGQQGYKVTTTNLGVATETIEFIDTGTILEITPYIDDTDHVLLEVRPTINTAKIEEGVPVVSSTEVTTWLLARDGETVFIGGLIQDDNREIREGIPCIGDIPLLGDLFGRTIRGTGKSELVVSITPRVTPEGPRVTPEGPRVTPEGPRVTPDSPPAPPVP